jgi:hypothetical protein
MPGKRKHEDIHFGEFPGASKLIHRSSVPSSKSEVAISEIRPTQTAIEKAYYTEYRPVAAITGTTPLVEFLIPANAEHYLDFDDMMLYVRFTATAKKTTTTPGAGGAAATTTVGDLGTAKFQPVQNLMHSMISKVDLVLQDKNITPSNQYYPYRAYFEKLLGFSKDAKKTYLRAGGWFKPSTSEGTSYASAYENGKPIELLDRLHLDLCNQERLMLNGVQVKLSLQMHKPEFYFEADAGVHIESLKFEQVALFVRHVKISDFQAALHKTELMKTPALYPISRNEVRQFIIPSETTSLSLDNVFNGQVPRRIFLAMVKNKSEQGAIDSNPFHFEHNKLNYLACFVNGEQFPSIAYTPDFDKNKCMREYLQLYRALNQTNPRPTPSITLENFKSGTTIFGFNLAPDESDGCDGHYNLIKRGNVRFEIKLAGSIKEVISVLLFCEFDNLIQVDNNRNVFTDYC